EFGQRGIGDQYLAACRGVRYARGDVDVDTEIVVPDPLGCAAVQPDTQLRAVVTTGDGADCRVRTICRGDSFGSLDEHCHHPVPEGFHHCATTVGYGFITRRTDVVQQLQHLLVACLQGPLGERDEVGEHDGAFPFTGLPPTSATGGRMPDLHTGEPEF